jgi:hypothetical protein
MNSDFASLFLSPIFGEEIWADLDPLELVVLRWSKVYDGGLKTLPTLPELKFFLKN